ncbi:MAG TPA: TetR/AcrR family transcriptional regulator C-terminal domain-containing protein [Streptosporangiaceae bacterium]|nr:TetR/AcrR family transcriptional regulator C-terminal domain-containing protein [Streptosporangiaceae bacterium]
MYVDGGMGAYWCQWEAKLLTKDRIVRAATGIIEREGADALSMRRVAAELGVAVMSLYNHVPSKAALLDAVAERILAGMSVPAGPALHWTERARCLVRAFREVANDYPRSVTLVLTRKVDAPSGMRPVEHALAVAAEAGFDGETSVRIMRALLAYAIGAQMREVGALKMLDYLRKDDPTGGPPRLDFLDPGQFPHVVALQQDLLRHDPDTDFEFGLDLLLTAVDLLPRTAKG